MILLFPSLINFKSAAERKKFDPSCHIFYGQRLLDIPDGLPKWSGMNDKSDLIGDSPPEAIRKRKKKVEDEEGGEEGKAKQVKKR